MTMMRIKDVFKPKGLLAICFLVAIGWFCIPTAKTAREALKGGKPNEKIQGTIQRIHKQCVSRFDRKFDFIDLNGLFCRICGIRVSNGIVRLDNGFLIPVSIGRGKPKAIATNIIGFSRFLKQRKIPFLYVQAPYKMDRGKKMLPPSFHHYAYESVDELLSALSTAKVDFLDLRPFFSESVEDVERYFYRTDHHWNGDAIFAAYQLTVQSMADRLEVPQSMISDEINVSSWHRRTRPDWFLGSWGQRTGRFFGGLDEIIWHEPKFSSQLSCARIRESMWAKGDFASAVILRDYVETRPDLFTKSAYGLYGGTKALVCYRNSHAPVKKKILMVGDSFAYPVWALCSAVFSEIDTLDPRLLNKFTIAEYVVQTKPDMVVQLVNSNVFTALKCFRYGTPEAVQWEKSTFVRNIPIRYELATNNVDTVIVPTIRRGFNYVVDATGFAGSPLPEMVELALLNVRSGNVWRRMMFDTGFCNERKRVHWEFSVPEVGDWDLRIRGKGSQLIRFENLKVTELRSGKKHSQQKGKVNGPRRK